MVANIPSSIIVTRVGAPAWLAFLMLSWGIVSACTAAVRTRAQFFCIRVLLGITEAGCFPGARAQPTQGLYASLARARSLLCSARLHAPHHMRSRWKVAHEIHCVE